MAKFIVLKNGIDYKVFNYEGNIARIGSGSTVDFQLETTGIEGDLFFVTKTSGGYEIERRARGLSFTINGTPITEPTLLKDGDKVGFLDYIMIVKYESQGQPAAAAVAPPPQPAPPKPVVSDTAPQVSAQPEPKPKVEPPKPTPKGVEKPTMIIDAEALAAQARQAKPMPSQPAPERLTSAPARPPQPAPVTPQAAKTPAKPKITPVYTLCVLTGQHKGRAFEIDTAEYLIGRERGVCDLTIDHDEHGQPEMAVSREHCVITSTDEGLYLTDKRSQLRTFINRKVIEPGQREYIAPEDIISIPAPSGEVFLRLCFRGQENFAPVSFAKPISTRLIALLAAAIVILSVVLYILLR